MLLSFSRVCASVLGLYGQTVDVESARQVVHDFVVTALSSESAHVKEEVKRLLKEEVQRLLTKSITDCQTAHGFSREKLSLLLQNNPDYLRGLARRARARILCGAECEFNSLPEKIGSLTAEDMKCIFFLKVPEQTNGWTCGYWGVYNRIAMEWLRSEKKPFSNGEITERAKALYKDLPTHMRVINEQLRKDIEQRVRAEYPVKEQDSHIKKEYGKYELCEGKMPSIDALVKLAAYLDKEYALGGVSNLHFVTYQRENDQPGFSEEDPTLLHAYGVQRMEDIDIQNGLLMPEEIARRFSEGFEGRRADYYLCYLYDPSVHWILLPVVQFGEYKPVMIVLDSYNYNVTSDGDAAKVIEFIYKLVVRPLRERSPLKDL